MRVFLFPLLLGLTACEPRPSQNPPTSPMPDSPNVTVRLLDASGQLTPPTAVPRIVKTEAEWQAQLSPEQFAILRAKGTERPFCGMFYDNHQDGLYLCAGCDLPLFSSSAKFDSGTGWPSFLQPVAAENITALPDHSHGMHRTEILCTRCAGHLGHVFEDGPPPLGLRYCLNSESLRFVPSASQPSF